MLPAAVVVITAALLGALFGAVVTVLVEQLVFAARARSRARREGLDPTRFRREARALAQSCGCSACQAWLHQERP